MQATVYVLGCVSLLGPSLGNGSTGSKLKPFIEVVALVMLASIDKGLGVISHGTCFCCSPPSSFLLLSTFSLPSLCPISPLLLTAPSYDNNQQQQQQQEQTGSNNQAAAATGGRDSQTDKAWCSITVPQDMGLAATRYKWRQGLCHVEVFVRLPDSITPKQV